MDPFSAYQPVHRSLEAVQLTEENIAVVAAAIEKTVRVGLSGRNLLLQRSDGDWAPFYVGDWVLRRGSCVWGMADDDLHRHYEPLAAEGAQDEEPVEPAASQRRSRRNKPAEVNE